MARFAGVYTIMPTPFVEGGELDLASLARLTEFLVGLGVDGVVVLGVMGEAPKLSDEEHETVIRTTVAATAGRIPVFAGSGAAGTDLAIRKSSRAIELGAAGLLVAPPPVQSDTVILEYYRRLGAAVQRPVILHDYPAATGIRLSPELIARLHQEVPEVEVVKLEEPPTGPKVSAIRRLGSSISIVGGLGGVYFLEELERGSDGMMTGFSFPELLQSIFRSYTGGNIEQAKRTFYDACPLLRWEFQPGIGLALRKEIYRRRGAIDSAYIRHPGVQIDAQLKAELDSIVEYCGLSESLSVAA